VERSYILDEIRRFAAANGGVAPGKERFERETGIKETSWRGRYWARWSDLLNEAGLSAGTMNVALDRELILEQVAQLVMELGHVPTAAEIRLEKRSRPSLPNDKTVGTRLGFGARLAAELLAYATGRPGLETVVEVCRPIAARGGPVERSTGPPAGIVYLMKSGRYYKIGRSNSAGRRLYEIGIQLPERVELVHSFETDDPEGIERYWHDRFAAKRRNGEWFDLDRADVAAFKRRKGFM
jgi:Meiotically up-regulated gene 113